MLNKLLLNTVLISSLVAGSAIAESSTPVHKGMNGIASDACISAVKYVEGEILKKLPIRTHPTINQKQPQQHTFSGITIMNYNGDDSQITLTATPSKTGCDVFYSEVFAYNEPCPIAREKVFKKWTFMGKMYDTMVFKFRRDEHLFGYLTPQGNNAICLVSKRKTFYR